MRLMSVLLAVVPFLFPFPAGAQDPSEMILGSDAAVALDTGCRPFGLAFATVGNVAHRVDDAELVNLIFHTLNAQGVPPVAGRASEMLIVELTVAPAFVVVLVEFRRNVNVSGTDPDRQRGTWGSTWRLYHAHGIDGASQPARAIESTLGSIVHSFIHDFKHANAGGCVTGTVGG